MGDGRGPEHRSPRAGLRVVLLGAPGSGKGTQAGILSRRLAVPAISTGEMLREAVAAGTSLGRRVEDVMATGGLVEDDLMAEVVRERLARRDTAHGFLLDGYPRTLPQAATLDAMLPNLGGDLDAVVALEVPQEMLVRRALGRGRADDEEDVVRERLRQYHEKTAPLVGHYEATGLLRRIDGNRTMDEVTAQVLLALGAGV